MCAPGAEYGPLAWPAYGADGVLSTASVGPLLPPRSLLPSGGSKTTLSASSDGGKTFGAPVDITDDRGGD